MMSAQPTAASSEPSFLCVHLHELQEIERRRAAVGSAADTPSAEAVGTEAGPPGRHPLADPVTGWARQQLRALRPAADADRLNPLREELAKKKTVDDGLAFLARAGAAELVPEFVAEKGSPAQVRDCLARQKRLVGLALSGGGVRSASFGLGVLQALAERSADGNA